MKYPGGAIARWKDNILFMRDGSVWVTFLTRGVRCNSYKSEDILAAQDAHAQLYTALRDLAEASDVMIGGLLENVTHKERLHKAVDGLDDYRPENPKYAELNNALHHYASTALTRAYAPMNRRVFFVSVRMPDQLRLIERLRSSILGSDIFGTREMLNAAEFSDVVHRAIPSAFRPIPATPEDVLWIFDRARTRGVNLAPSPKPTRDAFDAAMKVETTVGTERDAAPVTPPTSAFTDITIDPLADSAVTVDQYVAKYARGVKGTDKARSFAEYFSSLRSSKIISIIDPSTRTPEMPEGAKSFQSVFAIAGYPTDGDYSLDSIMGMLDRNIGLDGDWVQRIHFPTIYDDNEKLNSDMALLESENASNSKSVIDTAQYGTRASELAQFSKDRDGEPGAVPVHVTTLFALASPSATHLTRALQGVMTKIKNAGYLIYHPVGGQEALWRSMLPGSPRTSLIEELQGTSTATKLGAFAPMQRIVAGDPVGLPFATVIDNNLGTEFRIDVMGATQAGNGSMAFTGAQGKGKSHAMGVVASGLYTRNAHLVFLDTQGEWGSFVNAFDSHQVVDLKNPTVSLDPLRVFGATPEGRAEALKILRGLLLPMLGVRSDTVVGASLAKMIDPRWTEPRRITSTRELITAILRVAGTYELREVVPSLNAMLEASYMGAFIDPPGGEKLPPANLDARAIVFLTADLPVPSDEKDRADWTLEERYTILCNTAVAMITALLFSRVRGVPAVFFMDEAKTYEDLDVLTPLISEPDRKGRKHGQWVVVGSQVGADFNGPEYKLIRRRFCMGQDNETNAREALLWAGLPATDDMVSELVTGTSPLDPETGKPMAGRAGECFVRDNVSPARLRVYPHWDPRIRTLANTKSNEYVRYSDRKAAGEVT